MNTFRLFSRASFGRPFFSSFFRPSRGGTASQAFRSFHYFRPSFQRYRYVRFGDPPGRSSSGGLQTLWARLSPVQRIIVVGLGGGAPIFYVSHLETVPETGRRRFIFMSRSMEEAIGEMTYKQVMQQFQGDLLPPNHPYTRLCERVVERLGPATGMEGVKWQVHVIDQNVPNAFVIPGGQIFVFTGILPIAYNEAGLATILGHEIAHYTLRHIAEKNSMSQFFGTIGLLFAWTFGIPPELFLHFQQLALDLPNSRATETEADYVGLLYMAKACYNPEEGPKVWERMSKMAKGQPEIPQFLSTHPQNQDRQERLHSHMEEARQKAVESGCADTGSMYGQFGQRFRESM